MYPFQSEAAQAGCATNASDELAPDLTVAPVPPPSPRLLAVAGAALLRQLVRGHHALLRQSEIAHLFDGDEAADEAAVARAADLVVEHCGGPPATAGAQRAFSTAFTVDEAGRAVWLGCLWQALADSSLPAVLREEYWTWMEALSIRMLDRHSLRGPPRRYPFAQVRIGARPRGFAMCPR